MQARLCDRKNINTDTWNELVDSSPQGSVFVYTYYIDALFGDSWQGIVVEDQGAVCAVMPLKIGHRLFFKTALQPTFTKYWGLCMAGLSFKNTYEEYSWKKKVIEAAISAIPAGIDLFEYNFHPSFDYGIPFHIKGYELGLKYSYVLDLSPAPDEILNNFQSASRKNVNKALREGKQLKYNALSAAEIIGYMKKEDNAASRLLDEKSFKTLERLVETGLKCNFLYTNSVYSASGALECFAILLYDKRCTYFLAQYLDPAYKATDTNTFLIYNGFLSAKANTTKFDFMGSMLEGVESFNRRFGAKPVPYLTVSRYHKLVKALKR